MAIPDGDPRNAAGQELPAGPLGPSPRAIPSVGTDDEAAGTATPLLDARAAMVPKDQRTPWARKKGGDTLDT